MLESEEDRRAVLPTLHAEQQVEVALIEVPVHEVRGLVLDRAPVERAHQRARQHRAEQSGRILGPCEDLLGESVVDEVAHD